MSDKMHQLNLALNNTVNQRLIEYLNEKGPTNVRKIQDDFRMAQCAISYKLSQLKDFKIVKCYKSGRKVYYSVNNERIDKINSIINQINEL